MDFKLQMGKFIYQYFFMWPYVVKCITTGYLFYVWGGVSVGLFFLFFLVISICTELFLFWEGDMNNM